MSKKILFEIHIPVTIDDNNLVALAKYEDGAIDQSEVPAVRNLESAINDYRVMKQIVEAIEASFPLPQVKPAQKYAKLEVGPAQVKIVSLSAAAGK